jgi:phytoene desaturase
VGGGIGGLSAAIRLAQSGQPVLVLEQNPTLGGKMNEIRADGYRWDTGPSVITMRPVLEAVFAQANRRMEDYLTLQPVEPLTRYFYPDGTVLDISRDWPKLAEQISRIDERDVEGYARYLAYAARLHRITGPAFIYGEPPSLRSFTQFSPLDVLHIDGLRSMDAAIRSFVHSSHMRQLLGRFATYVGASPYRAPATLNVIAHVELTGGVWYPQGGIYSIARALGRLADELGVEVRTNCGVQQILLRDGRVQGVQTQHGEIITAETVIANIDVAAVYENLLPAATAAARAQRLKQAEPSCSGFVMLLGIEGPSPQLAHHNIFFSSDYPREFADIFDRGIPPTEPTIYVAITAKSDPQDAPPGCENWFVLVNAPPLGPQFDWASSADTYGRQVLNRLADYGLDIRSRIRSQRLLTPLDLERLTGARRGALYGASSNNRFAAFRRPHNRAPDVRGLYFAGGTTHPGGGVPMVMLSGKLAAEMALTDAAAR